MKTFSKFGALVAAGATSLALSTAAFAQATPLDTAMDAWDPVSYLNEHGAKIITFAIILSGILIVVGLVKRGRS